MALRVVHWYGWFKQHTVTATVVGRSEGGFHLRVRYRCILGYMREKWVTADEVAKIDDSFNEVAELERMLR